MYMYFKIVFVFGKMILLLCFIFFLVNFCGFFSVLRSIKFSFNYLLGSIVCVIGCRVGIL